MYKVIVNFVLDTQDNIFKSQKCDDNTPEWWSTIEEKQKKLARSHGIKVCKSFDERGSNGSTTGIVQSYFYQKHILLLSMTTGRPCSCTAMFSIVYSLFKNIRLWDSKDLSCILTQSEQI